MKTKIIIILLLLYLLTKKNKERFQQSSFSRGMIAAWRGTTPPSGWVLCDGNNGTPDLRGRFVLGYNPDGGSYTINKLNDVGGSEKHILTIEEMPTHNHGSHKIADDNSSCVRGGGGCACDFRWDNTGNVGKSQPHNNMPPYYVLAYIMKL